MSAEAADRVAAVASSRPSTPLQTSWFEFLLDGSLLEKHLEKSNPGTDFIKHSHGSVYYQDNNQSEENVKHGCVIEISPFNKCFNWLGKLKKPGMMPYTPIKKGKTGV